MTVSSHPSTSRSDERQRINRRRWLIGSVTTGTVGLSTLMGSVRTAQAERPSITYLTLEDTGTPFGTSMGRRILSQDPDTQATTSHFSFPAPWQGGGTAHYHSCAEEVYVIEGDITLNGRDYLTAGSYLYRPSGIVHGHDEGSINGCRCIIRTDGALDFTMIPEPESPEEYVLVPSDDGRSHVLHLRTPDMDWTWQSGNGEGYGTKILSEDRITGATTSLVTFPAGWTGELMLDPGIAWEWFVIRGNTTLNDGTVYQADTYSYRPARSQPLAFTAAETDTDILLWKIL